MARWNLRARAAGARALLAAAVLCGILAPATAEVRVTDLGNEQLVIEAHDATVLQVLQALGQTRTMEIEHAEALSRRVSGTYSGNLRRVLSRVLDGYDHVIISTSAGVRIDVVGTAQAGGITVPGGPTMTASGPRVGPRVAPRVSSNLDADEEAVASKPPVGPQTVNLASGPRQSVPVTMAPPPADVTGATLRPRVSSNLDADEEAPR